VSICDIHPSARLGSNVKILGDLSLAQGVEVGSNVIFYPNVFVGANSRILEGSVIGRPPIRAGTTNRPVNLGDRTVRIGADRVVGANCVLYTHVDIARNVLICDLTSIREGSRLAEGVVIGRMTTLMHDVSIGERTRITDNIHITGNAHIEADVFIGPGVSSANDNDVYLRRFGLLPFETNGPTIRRFAVIGTGAILAPGIEIGTGAVVATGATATKDVPPWTIVAGAPARGISNIDEETRMQVLQHFSLNPDETA
jgi:acetyltransferase-like isoleucine patch superfamily enzyme